jgi:hypothetical protein
MAEQSKKKKKKKKSGGKIYREIEAPACQDGCLEYIHSILFN